MPLSVKLERLFDDSLLEYLLKVEGRKKSTCGMDGVYPSELRKFWKDNNDIFRELILAERYIPVLAEKIKIPKPESKKKREIIIYCVVDRMIMHGLFILLYRYFERRFSRYSYGFRQGKGCHDALRHAINTMNDGYDNVIRIDIKEFFDSINHDQLIRILDKDIVDSFNEAKNNPALQAQVVRESNKFEEREDSMFNQKDYDRNER